MSFKLALHTPVSSFGTRIKTSVFGGSHEPFVGVTMEGLPTGIKIDMDALQRFLARRAPGNSPLATPRKEADHPVAMEGLEETITTGGPLTFVIENTNTRSGDYAQLSDIPRPGHGDFTAYMKYSGCASPPNMAGGGPFSARMTAPLCIAGGIALQLLSERGITIGGHIASISTISDASVDEVNIEPWELSALKEKDFPVFWESAGDAMKAAIRAAATLGDSLGGTVEVCVLGLPAGIGGPMYDGVESVLAPILFGIPAVKGIEFGNGFGCSQLFGSENNDPFYMDGDQIKTRTNHHGGILGGITSGMPLILRLAFKPTPSISREQDSVSLSRKENVKLSVKGRHDPCVVPRAVPVCEAAVAIGLLDLML